MTTGRGRSAARDEHYEDPRLVALYDVLNGWSPARAFYLARAGDPPQRLLDAGCGTGLLAVRYAAAGHDVVGVDPAPQMLAAARARRGGDIVEWRGGALGSGLAVGRPFDLIVMTGHAFQCLLTDEAIAAAFDDAARMLAPGGRFIFETRNPAPRPWERWRPKTSRMVGTPPAGGAFEAFHDLVAVEGPLVTFETTYLLAGEAPIRSRSTLRFTDAATLSRLAAGAGLRVAEALGDWDGGPLSATAPEIILTLAR